MSSRSADVVRAQWSAPSDPDGAGGTAPDEFGPQRTCRNMREVTFDGMAEPGSDLGEAWRERLRREGKLGRSSLADLVLGEGGDAPTAR